MEGVAKCPTPKSLPLEVKAAVAVSPKCPGRTPPSSHKFQKHGDPDHMHHHRDHHGRMPRVYKWSFQMCTCFCIIFICFLKSFTNVLLYISLSVSMLCNSVYLSLIFMTQ